MHDAPEVIFILLALIICGKRILEIIVKRQVHLITFAF